MVRSENPFWAKTPYSPFPPDNVIIGNEALKAGEVGWGYVMNGTQAGTQAVSKDDPDQFIAVTPVFRANSKDGSGSRTFDGKELSVRVDGSVRIGQPRPGGKIVPGSGPEAGGGTPVIKAPKTRESH